MAFLALGIASTMTPVAFVLFAREVTHSFASASLVLAASTAGALLLGPARGRLVDRLGARRAILLLVVPDIATDVAFIAGGKAGLTPVYLVVLGFVAGAVTAPASAALRSVWSDALAGSDSRQAGYALMTMMQEMTFIAGPLVAGAVIALWSAAAAVATTAVLSFVGAVVFATAAPRVRPEQEHKPSRRLPALAGSGIRTVVATAGAFGLTFGLLDVAFPAFARAHGSVATAGVLLSAFAGGSWLGGFVYGLRPRDVSAGHRYPRLCLLAAAGLAPLIIAPGLAAMVVLSALSGVCFAPITTCQTAVIDEVVGPSHKAEAFTWLGTVYGAGVAAGAALSGQLVASAGVRGALALACAATLLAWVLTLARASTLREPSPTPAQRGAEPRPLPGVEP